MNHRYLWIFPFLSGILFFFSFPPYNLRILPWVSFLPLFFFLNYKKISFKKAFLAGLITGLVFLGSIMFWFFDTLPLDWAGIEGKFLGFSLVLLVWALTVFVLSFFVGLFSLTYHFLARRNYWDVLLIPSLWVIFEYLRAWSFGILWLGKESLFGPHWTFGNLAYISAQNQSLRVLAGFGGIYLISFSIVFINVLLFLLIRSKKLILSLIIIALISAGYFISFPETQAEDGILKIAVLQTKFPSFFYLTPEMKQERLAIQNELFEEALELSPDVVVFPEDARFLLDQDQGDFFVINSARTETAQGVKSIASFYGAEKGILAQYEKLLLAPAGEYLPYFIKLPIQIFNKEWVDKFENSRGYRKGKEVVVFSSPQGWQLGVLFCSETLSPNLHYQLAEKGTQIFVNLGSLAFSHGSKLLDAQTRAALQLRAVENKKYLVRATNFGTSYIINPRGEIIEESDGPGNQLIFAEIPLGL